MCRELQQRIYVIAFIMPSPASVIASVLGTTTDAIVNALTTMSDNGLLLSEDDAPQCDNDTSSDTGILRAYDTDNEISMTLTRRCAALCRAYRQQMTFCDSDKNIVVE